MKNTRIIHLKDVNEQKFKVVKSLNHEIVWLSINTQNLSIDKPVRKFYKNKNNKQVPYINTTSRKIKIKDTEYISGAWIPLNKQGLKELIKVLNIKLKQLK